MLGFAQTQQGSALHPPGALPLDPATFEKVDETFILRFAPVLGQLI